MCDASSVFDDTDAERNAEDSETLRYGNGEEESTQSMCDLRLLGALSAESCSSRPSFFSTPPAKGIFLDLIDGLLRSGTASSVSQASGKPLQDEASSSTDDGAQRFFTTELVDQLCDEAQAVLEGEKVLLNIELKKMKHSWLRVTFMAISMIFSALSYQSSPICS
ncbi:phosphoprotein phosphatase [Trypanosoma conorhini]|uniref:Phosphoprotein phosphatase n=1 Tax=Trypanosoma conorhini TaxID=83891 RepID=A0A422PM77_9TRYP|nr:phosphoprotein phosphatase [Trypanosoma conorhini]RNF18801.1 phosphoprotein phosphatase [Trypanosoma conorhini]